MRHDIQGMRALSVLAVILFHLGYLDTGYLGVDVFFVISGFLICGGLLKRNFDYWDFVKRRVTRILPLSLSVTLICLPVACALMLPDDLENFAASAVATVFMSNNILQLITTADYWDIVNEFKPLLHTWSLGVEEQYYLLFPFLFLGKVTSKTRVVILTLLSTLSVAIFIVDQNEARNFYWLPSRIFEFGLGALLAFKKNGIARDFINIYFIGLFLLVVTGIVVLPEFFTRAKLALLVATTTALILLAKEGVVNRTLLGAGVLVWTGNISYSLYMWHQPVLAFTRYSFVDAMDVRTSIIVLAVTLMMSVMSYYFIEEYFRKKSVPFRKTAIFTISTAFITTTSSLFIYNSKGIIQDHPLLGISVSSPKVSHNDYNHRAYSWEQFSENGQTKVLCVGNSYARDFANILFEHDSLLDIAYVFDSREKLFETNKSLFETSDIVLWTELDTNRIDEVKPIIDKLFVVGPKQFGNSSGRTYYKSRFEKGSTSRALVSAEILAVESNLRYFWKSHFLSILECLLDEQNSVPTLTANGKLISQDSRHLTKFGAEFLATKLDLSSLPLNTGHAPTNSKSQ